MNIKFDLTLTAETEAMHGPIPIAMECNIEARCEYVWERPVIKPNRDAYPGYEHTTVLKIESVVAMVDWYTPAPDGTMTVYHYICFALEDQDAERWLNAWNVDVQAAVDKEEISYEDVMG
jgi:hypothetical protein